MSAKHRGKNVGFQVLSDYVVLDHKATWFSPTADQIAEILALKV